MGELKMLLM
jgi:hypothetical protein